MPEERAGHPAESSAEDELQQTDGFPALEIESENYYTKKMPEDALWRDEF